MKVNLKLVAVIIGAAAAAIATGVYTLLFRAQFWKR